MPELESTYRPAWWLPGAHLPTIWGKKVRRIAPVHDRVERWTAPDGDRISVARAGEIAVGIPHLLVLHGLEGSVQSNYAQGLLSQARLRGWSADLMLFRGCDGHVNSARRMYHSGETADLDFVVRTLVERQPDIDLRIVGVSLGGNVLLKWLGERGESLLPNVRRAAGVSVPYDLASGSRILESNLGRRYANHFMTSLKAKALAKRAAYPDLCDWTRLEAAQTFWEFDDCLTGPVHGFAGALDYYTKSSSINYLAGIRRPTLLLSAEDDPFLPVEVLHRVRKLCTDNDYMTIEFTRRGGHVGWTEGPLCAPRYYMETKTVSWLSGE
jgi:uncharacterized protein